MAKKITSKVISTRVPTDIERLFTKQANKLGITKSAHLKNMVMGNEDPEVYKQGGLIEVPDDVRQVLSGMGGVGIGYLVYKAVNQNLQDKEYTKDQIVMYSSISAIACGLLGGMALNELVKSISK